MKRTATFLVLAALALAPVRAGEEAAPPPDGFALALARMGIGVADLGYRPPAHFARYPHPKTTPYVLPFFEDLLASPLDTYSFARELGNAVEDHLTPAKLREAPEPKKRKETLFRLGVVLGTDRLIGGFRGYSANLDPRPETSEPLYHALVALRERSGRPLRRPMAFGGDYGTDDETPEDRLREQVAAVPEALRLPLAKLVLNLVAAREWIDLGLRRVDDGMRRDLFAALPALSEETPDGTGFHPVFDDVARALDAPSLYYGCLKAFQATQDFRRDLLAVTVSAETWPAFLLRLDTAWGEVVAGSASEAVVEVAEPLLVVDFSGRLPLSGPLGATGPERPLSVAVLVDHETADAGMGPTTVGAPYDADLRADADAPRLASGVLGCGVLYAAGETAAVYRSGRYGLGAGCFGLGALVEEGGSDRYEAPAMAQGAGFFGVGLLLDASGDDEYLLLEGDGQGYGGCAGIGVLADRAGDDLYRSEPLASEAGRADYHSADEIAVSSAQGVGGGRRGDGSDGHSWAGGLGALLDVEGNDRYVAGNFSQGLGYWYGTGLLWDGGGDDRFESVYFTQGSGAHFAIGALIDEGGNDEHVLGHNAGAGLGFGWDVVNAFLIDRGNGNDRYEAKIISSGLAEVRSNAFLLDEGGDDVYVLDEGTRGFGDVDRRDDYEAPGRTHQYPFRLAQVGMLLDLSGKDRYLRRAQDGSESPDPRAGDGLEWNLRRSGDAPGGANVSIGLDLDGARLGFLDPWPARKTEDGK